MKKKEYFTLRELAAEMGIERSHARKWTKKNGFEVIKVRTNESRGQPTLAVSPGVRDAILALRRSQGFNPYGVISDGADQE